MSQKEAVLEKMCRESELLKEEVLAELLEGGLAIGHSNFYFFSTLGVTFWGISEAYC